jgi:hypothetical protein
MGDTDAEVPAPMCGPDGASIPAGDDIPEIDRGHFEALPCEAQLWLATFGKSDGERGCRAVSASDTDPSAPCPTAQPTRPRYDGAHGFAVPFPERAEPMLAAFAGREGLAPSRGHAPALFRPPVARA